MIKVIITKTDDKILKVSMEGHANYDDYGKDIVCSAASSILITTVNGIHSIESEILEVSEAEGNVLITVQKENEICQILLRNMIKLLLELSEQYPKNIKVM